MHPFKATALLLLFAISNVLGDELQCPNNYTVRTTMKQLRKYAFCKYDRSIRPVRKYNDTVDVQVRLLVRRIEFDDRNDALKVHSFFVMRWYDYHLMWNPSSFDGISYLTTPSYTVWQPDLDVLNSADSNTYMHPYYTSCELYSDGEIIFVPPVTYVTSCSANLINWPYDQHKCKMAVGSWTHSGEELNITLLSKPLLLFNYETNSEWKLVSLRGYREVKTFNCCPEDTYPSVAFEFVIQRHSGVYTASVVIPVTVLMMMTLISFWMTPTRSDRLFVTAIDLFSHFIYLQHLGEALPSNGSDTPLIVTFLRDSLVLTTMALVMAITGKLLESSNRPAPLWALGISSTILENRVIQLIASNPVVIKQVNSDEPCIDGETLTDFPALSPKSDWNKITEVLDIICFIIALLVYAILMIGFVP